MHTLNQALVLQFLSTQSFHVKSFLHFVFQFTQSLFPPVAVQTILFSFGRCAIRVRVDYIIGTECHMISMNCRQEYKLGKLHILRCKHDGIGSAVHCSHNQSIAVSKHSISLHSRCVFLLRLTAGTKHLI